MSEAPMTITDEMVSVAQQAASSHAWPHSQFRAALEAAAPLIRAADAERIAKLEEALLTIEAQTPKEDPGPACDEWGWRNHGNYDDVASDAVAEQMWKVGEIARAVLARSKTDE